MEGAFSSNTSNQRFSYSVKVINPKKESEYVVQNYELTVFKSVDELKENLVSVIPSAISQVGYIEPGHDVKGKQRWLSACEDLKDMYLLHQCREL